MSLKQVAEIFGYDLQDESKFNADEFKSFVDEKYILKDNAVTDEGIKSKIVGKVLGSATTKLGQLYGLTSSQIDGKKIEEVAAMGKAKFEEEIKLLKESAGQNNDDAVKKLSKKLEEREAAFLEVEKALENERVEKQNIAAKLTGELKSVKLNTKVKEIKQGVPFTDEFKNDKLKYAGFEALIGSKYKLDLDENDEPVVTFADGKPVPHPKKTGHHASFADVLAKEAEELGVLKKSNAEPVRTISVIKGGDLETAIAKKVHPNAQKNLEKLRTNS